MTENLRIVAGQFSPESSLHLFYTREQGRNPANINK